ncbi:unnamed protein product [Mytilus coruscus]|uniref:ZP domain-containing protein n=1 Tax=Mytilus coruscus TaxID=42192 RepID=A0A6J8F027_MYTCO|nr:unnamed protein product [Mytilus coruscus]
MLSCFTERLRLFILFVSASVSISKVIEAHVKVINATCYDDMTNHNNCSTFTLKIGYYPTCAADDKLSPGNRFEYDYGSKYEFNTSTHTIFTRGLEKTGAKYLMVVVMIVNMHNNRSFTSCGRIDDNSQVENGNSTVVHTKSYYSGSSVYCFDIEIETVCDTSLCFGLKCDKCVTDHTTTLYSNADTSKPFSASTEYIKLDETTAPSSINITSRHITATDRTRIASISTAVNQTSLAGSDEVIVIISSVVGFVLLLGILVGIAYKHKSKRKLRNQHTRQATEQLPSSIFLHTPEVNGKECLENRIKINVSNNRTDQTQLTQDIGNLLEKRHKKSKKKTNCLENEESKQGDNQTLITNHDKKKRKKHKKKLKDNNSSENSSCKINMDESQQSQHIKGRSAIADTSSVNKETQETFPVYDSEQQNNKRHSDINDVMNRSHKPAKQIHESTTCETDRFSRGDVVMEPKSTTGKTDEPYESDGRVESLLPPIETDRSYENKSVKIDVRPRSAMPSQNGHIPEEMLKVKFTKSKSTLETTSINGRPDGITLQVNNLMPKNA